MWMYNASSTVNLTHAVLYLHVLYLHANVLMLSPSDLPVEMTETVLILYSSS